MVSNYKIFKTIAIVLGLIIFFWLIYDYQNSIVKVNQNYIRNRSLLLSAIINFIFVYVYSVKVIW